MSTGRSDTSSKRKRSTPQKFKSRKLFASSRHDILEQPEFSRARDGGAQEDQLGLSKLPVTLQNKENMPEKCPNGSVTSARGRGRPKGSKNKTFPTLPTKVYAVREGKPPVYSSNPEDDDYIESPNTAITPHRGRGRPRGSTKVKLVDDDAPKRSRGRPKGSKNKKPSKATLLKIITTGKKIGRGRPRKIPHETDEAGEALTPKRGRGRPKGSLNKTKSGKRLSHVSGSLEGKKRGRPKKIMLHHSTLLSLTPKRPRGRPKKKGSLEAVPSSQDHEDDEEFAPLSESLEVKKRGRPKKIILHHFALKSLTPKRPRGRPRKKGSFEAAPSPDHHDDHHELKTSESNTEDEDDVDSEEDDGDDNDDDDDDK